MISPARMLKRVLMAALIFATGCSNRVVRINWQVLERLHREEKPYLLGFWHNNILSAIHFLGRYRYPVMISRSRDGDDINWVAERFGFEGLRGSPRIGASSAMREALRCLARGRGVIVTPDGPTGPRYQLKPGIIALARRTGAPIVPLCFSTERRWEFSSWDRMKLPKPFARLAIVVGDPIHLAPGTSAGGDGAAEADEDEETQRVAVEAALRRLVRTAEAFTGADAHFDDPALRGDAARGEAVATPDADSAARDEPPDAESSGA